MKTKFLLIAILFFSLKSFSQNYIPMNLDTSCYWVMQNTGTDGTYICYYETLTYIEKDTLINNKVYQKLNTHTTNTGACDNRFFSLHFLNPETKFVREDTLLKKIFFINTWSVQENVLYDFNLQVGDSISCNSIIDSITNESINGVLSKVYWLVVASPVFSPTMIQNYIEGIGSKSGFSKGSCGGYGNLKCYSKGGQILYGDTSQPCLKKPAVAVSTKDIFMNNFTLNYSNNSFQINNPNNEKLKIVLLDLMGNTIISQITNSLYYQSKISNSISTGIYILQVGNEKGRVVKKIVIE